VLKMADEEAKNARRASMGGTLIPTYDIPVMEDTAYDFFGFFGFLNSISNKMLAYDSSRGETKYNVLSILGIFLSSIANEASKHRQSVIGFESLTGRPLYTMPRDIVRKKKQNEEDKTAKLYSRYLNRAYNTGNNYRFKNKYIG